MNILSIVEFEEVKSKASHRMNDYLQRESLEASEELKLITSVQTLLFLSLLENKDASEIARNRELSATIFQKFGHHASSTA